MPTDLARMRTLTCYVIEDRASPDFVVEAFRAINQPGVHFKRAEVERLVAAVVDFK